MSVGVIDEGIWAGYGITTPHQVAVADTLRGLGAEIVEVTLPPIELTQAAASLLASAEASAEFRAHLARGARFAEDIQASPPDRYSWQTPSQGQIQKSPQPESEALHVIG